MGRVVAMGMLLLSGCGPTLVPGETGEGASGAGTSSTSAAPATTVGVSTTTVGDDASADSSGSAPAICGDGFVDPPEACDDGNLEDLDGCDSLCRLPGTELWEVTLPELSSCPSLGALDDGGVVAAGNELSGEVAVLSVLDADGSTRWTAMAGHGGTTYRLNVVDEPGGFVVSGRWSATEPGIAGWLQRWTADGVMVGETLIDIDELGSDIFLIERRDPSSYWIIGRSSPAEPRQLLFRSFDEPPASAVVMDSSAYEVGLATTSDGRAYVTVDADVSTLAHYSSGGGLVWTQTYETADGFSSSASQAIASTMTGDVIVAGTDQGSPDVQWIRRFAGNSTELWRTNLSLGEDPSGDFANHVVVDFADDIVVVGERRMDGGNNGFLAKYDGDGAQRWQQIWTAEGALNVRPCDLVTTSSGMIVVAGTDFFAGDSPTMFWVRAFTP